MTTYKVNDYVEVFMPYATPNPGWLEGRIIKVFPNYRWSGDCEYEIHGDNFVTIASERIIKNK